MKGHRKNESRVERGRRQRIAEWLRLAWWTVGIVLVVLFMAHNDLMNATGLLAVLGVMDVVSKAWKRLGAKLSGSREKK